MKGDHIDVQKTMFENHPHQDPIKKYPKNILWVVPRPIFPATKLGLSVDKKWFFCEKNHF